MSRNYKTLKVFQEADRFAKQVYRVTKSFPSDERFGVTSQFRRAALSIPLNIVEGCSRDSEKEFKRFLEVSIGSAFECEYLLFFLKDLDFLLNEEINELDCCLQGVIKMLRSLIAKYAPQ